MFRNTLRMLEQLNGTMTYKMDVLPDEDGYYDKELSLIHILTLPTKRIV